jgi:hypothetical protein
MGRQQGSRAKAAENPIVVDRIEDVESLFGRNCTENRCPRFSENALMCRRQLGGGRLRHWRAVVWAAIFIATLAPSAVRAVDAVNVNVDAPAIDLTDALEHPKGDGDRVQVSTAADAEGIVRRIEVRSREPNPHWVVFALANNGTDQIDRLLVAPRYRMVSSGLLWPDLGSLRLVNLTPSTGDPPERQDTATADIFRITLDPGAVVTFVAETRTEKLPQLYLWEPESYKDKVNSFTLYYGIVIGIAGLLALFLTILFVVKSSVMFPASAALSWAVLAYIGTDFGFWGKVFNCSPISTSTAGTSATPTSRRGGSFSSARSSGSRCSIRRSHPASRACRWR